MFLNNNKLNTLAENLDKKKPAEVSLALPVFEIIFYMSK